MNSRYSNKPPLGVFVATAIVIFFLSLSAADSIGFVPNYIDGTAPADGVIADSSDVNPSTDSGQGDSLALSELPVLGDVGDPTVHTALPTRIEIPAIDLDLTVQNPDTRDIE